MKQIILIIGLILASALLNNTYCKNTGKQINNNFPKEKLTVQFSQKCLLPGEITWFKIYNTSPLYPEIELSRIAFIELVNSENAVLLRKKILLGHGMGEGEFIIPETIKTGIYYIIAYTNWMKNFGEECFFKTTIYIINPNEEFNYQQINEIPAKSLNSDKKNDKTNSPALNTFSNKNEYATREKVKITINTNELFSKNTSGNFSIAVYKKEPLQHTGGKYNALVKTSMQPDSITYLADYKGIKLSGNITDDSGNPIIGEEVALSYPGSGTNINSTKTGDQGNFHFLLKPNKGKKDIVFSLPHSNLKLKLEESFWNGFKKPPTKANLQLDQHAISYLKERYSHFQLQKTFRQQTYKSNTPAGANKNSGWRFYGNPQQTIELNEYITLDSLTEYFWEMIPSVKFTQKKGKFKISVTNPLTLFPYKEAPGVFIDGVLYSDYDEIAAIPVELVSQIAIIDKLYHYRDFTFGGIIDIHTKKNDFKPVKILPNMVRIIYPLGACPDADYLTPDYSAIESKSRLPDLRYSIYWNPNITINESGKTTVEFYTSDIEGEFIVKVVGISNDGKILQHENEIIVKTNFK